MALNHGINTYKSATNFTSVTTATCGVPLFIGAWPCHSAKGFAGIPQLANTFSEAESLGGYSPEWRTNDGSPKWNLCQAMYSHFKLFAMSPAVFYNVFDPAKHKKSVTSDVYSVSEHTVTLSADAIDNENLVITTVTESESEESVTLEKGTDYEVTYSDGACVIELLPDSSYYGETSFMIAYDTADVTKITAADIEEAVEAAELCKSTVGIVPDLICIPGWSKNPTVAAVMAAKAANINGLYRAKAIVDIDTSEATDYTKVLQWKNANGYTSSNMIVCWPMVKNGDYLFDLSTVLCGLIASVDSQNNCPYESPSNKSITITGACTADGTEINTTLPQADVLSVTDGVVTVINNGGWVLWGNYTGCYPASADVAEYFICTNRMKDFLCNTFVDTFWSYIDRPLKEVLIDAIVNSFNSWLNGLTGDGKLYGGEIQYISDNNPTADLIGGKFRLDTQMASPVPAQRIDMYVEYNVDYLTEALSS